MPSTIIEAVEAAITSVVDMFLAESTRFFTENDLVCFFYSVLQQKLGPLGICNDADDNPHYLVHCEYPTPFRCSMSGGSFCLKTDKDQTIKGGLYQRGHYDIVVFNPQFVRMFSFPELRAQHYESFLLKVQPRFLADCPALVYGLEFHFKRNETKRNNGPQLTTQAETFAKSVRQDNDKLRAGKSIPGFMQHIKTLAFAKGVKQRLGSLIRAELEGEPDILLSIVEK